MTEDILLFFSLASTIDVGRVSAELVMVMPRLDQGPPAAKRSLHTGVGHCTHHNFSPQLLLPSTETLPGGMTKCVLNQVYLEGGISAYMMLIFDHVQTKCPPLHLG